MYIASIGSVLNKYVNIHDLKTIKSYMKATYSQYVAYYAQTAVESLLFQLSMIPRPNQNQNTTHLFQFLDKKVAILRYN